MHIKFTKNYEENNASGVQTQSRETDKGKEDQQRGQKRKQGEHDGEVELEYFWNVQYVRTNH